MEWPIDLEHFANTVVWWDQLCAAILRRNGRVELGFLIYAISKNAPANRGWWVIWRRARPLALKL